MAEGESGIVDRLFILLGLRTEDVDRGLNDLDSHVRDTMSSIAKNVIAPVLSFKALKDAIDSFRSASVELGTLSQATGMSMESLQGWSAAMTQAGADGESFLKTIYSMQEALSSFGMNETKIGLAQLGIDASTVTDELFFQISENMKTMTLQSAIQWGGKLGFDRDTIMAFREGRESLSKYIEEQRKNQLYTEQDYKLANKNRQAMEKLRTAWEYFTGSIAKGFVPVLTYGFEKLTAVLQYLQKHEIVFQTAIAGLIALMVARFIPALATIGKLLKSLGLSPKMFLFLATLASIGLLIDDLITYARGGKSYFEDFWKAFGTPEEVAAGIKEIKASLIEFLKWVASGGSAILKFVAALTLIAAPVITIINLLARVGSAVMAVIRAIAGLSIVRGIFGLILGGIRAVSAAIWGFLATNPVGWIIAAIAAAVGLVIYFWDDLKDYFIGFWNWLKNIGEKTIDAVTGFFKEMWDDFLAVGRKVKSWWDSLWGDEKEKEVEITENIKTTREPISPQEAPEPIKQRIEIERENAITVPSGYPENRQTPTIQQTARAENRPITMPPQNRRPVARELMEVVNRQDWQPLQRGVLQMGDVVAAQEQSINSGRPSILEPPAYAAVSPSTVTNNASNITQTTDVNISEIRIDAPDRMTAENVAGGIRVALNNNLARNLVPGSISGVNNK